MWRRPAKGRFYLGRAGCQATGRGPRIAKRLARRLIRLGVDAVIGSPPSCASKIVSLKHKKRAQVIFLLPREFYLQPARPLSGRGA